MGDGPEQAGMSASLARSSSSPWPAESRDWVDKAVGTGGAGDPWVSSSNGFTFLKEGARPAGECEEGGGRTEGGVQWEPAKTKAPQAHSQEFKEH